MSFIAVSSFAICFILVVVGVWKRREVDLILMVGVVLRFASVAFYCLVGDSDPDGYGYRAVMFADMDLDQLLVNFQTGAYFYSWLISFPYRLFGESPEIIRCLNGLLSCVSLFMAYDLARALHGDEPAKRAAIFLAVFPALIRFAGPFASRECLFVFLCMAALTSIYKYYLGKGGMYLIPASVCIIFACIVHTSAFMFFVLVLLIVMNNSTADKGMRLLIGVLGASAVGAGVYLMFRSGIGTEKLYLNNGGMDLEKLNWISESSADGRAAYLQGFTFTNPVLTALFLPVRAAFFLYAPFIWMVCNALDVFGLVDGVLYLFVTWCAIRNIRSIMAKKANASRDEKFVLYLCVMLLCMLAMFAIGTSNYGTALRHRAKLISMFVLLCGPFLRWPFHLKSRHEGVCE